MIAILSDFGNSEYVGIMKGRILQENPKATITDLSNFVSAQNVKEGAWTLYNAYKNFPKGTVFLCVVDPGVGTDREAIAVKTNNYFFVGPDNGLFAMPAVEDGIVAAVRLDTKDASKTFHGRDVFAPAAGKISKTGKVESMGPPVALERMMSFHVEEREGEVVKIDSFGNIITTLPHTDAAQYSVITGEEEHKLSYFDTYAEAPDKKPFLITGSSGTLEISIKNGNANEHFQLRIGQRVSINVLSVD